MALVYIVTNLVNGKRYIGYTSNSLKVRRSQHFCAASCKNPGMIFARAIKKYGKKNFKWVIHTSDISIDEAVQVESELIAKLRPEYNVSLGGRNPFHGVPWTERRRQLISAKLKGRKFSAERIANLRAALNPAAHYKKVVCLDDGVVHESILAAASYYGLSKKGISEACCGRGISVNGKHFAHYREGFSETDRVRSLAALKHKKAHTWDNSAKARSRPVVCTTDGKQYPSGRAAAQAYSIHASAVMYFCQTGRKSRSGLRFMYADQSEPVEPKIDPEKKALEAIRRREQVLKMSKATSKKVLCLDDGITYESISSASRAIGKNTSLLAAAIQRNGKCGGRSFVYADTPSEIISERIRALSIPRVRKLPDRAPEEQLARAKEAQAAGRAKSHAKISHKVICENDNIIHKSICAAARYYGISHSCINSSINRDGTTRGLKFVRVNEAQRKAKIVAKKKPFRRQVVCIDTGETFRSLAEAGRRYGVSDSHICEVCTGRRVKTAKGLSFKYVEAA